MDRYHHGSLRPVLLKAAAKLVGKLGVEGLTLREVARRAGVSHNAPYRHFKSREELVAALAAESFLQLRESVTAAVADTTAPADKLRQAAAAYLEFALANPARFDVMFHSALDGKAYPEYVAASLGCWELLSELIRENAFPGFDEETAGDLVWSSVHGIATLGLARRLRNGDADQLKHLAIAAVNQMLQTPAAIASKAARKR